MNYTRGTSYNHHTGWFGDASHTVTRADEHTSRTLVKHVHKVGDVNTNMASQSGGFGLTIEPINVFVLLVVIFELNMAQNCTAQRTLLVHKGACSSSSHSIAQQRASYHLATSAPHVRAQGILLLSNGHPHDAHMRGLVKGHVLEEDVHAKDLK